MIDDLSFEKRLKIQGLRANTSLYTYLDQEQGDKSGRKRTVGTKRKEYVFFKEFTFLFLVFHRYIHTLLLIMTTNYNDNN